MTTDRPRADRRPVPPHVWVILILGGGAFLLAALVALVMGYALLHDLVLNAKPTHRPPPKAMLRIVGAKPTA